MSEPIKSKGPMEQRSRGLLSAFSEEEDLLFMSEVDAAIHRKGSSIAYVLTLVIAVLLVVFVLWAHFTVLDEVTRGLGQVIPPPRLLPLPLLLLSAYLPLSVPHLHPNFVWLQMMPRFAL